MKKYGLHGKLTAKEGSAETLTSILLRAAELVSKAKGCHIYIVGKEAEDSNSVWITEVWDTKEDHANSLAFPGVKELIAEAIPLLAEMPKKGQELEILGGVGLQ